MTNPIAYVNLFRPGVQRPFEHAFVDVTYPQRFTHVVIFEIARAVHCEIVFSSRETEISTEISCRVLRNKVFNPKSPILFIHVSDIELGILSVRAFLNFLTSPFSCLLISKIYWFSDRLTNYTRFHI